MAELIKRFGFTVYAFLNLSRMLAHLRKNPLTAAAFLQGDLAALEPKVREAYQGPLYELTVEKESMMEALGANLREVHKNQLRVQDPKILRILKTFDAFSRGTQKTLLLMGEQKGLDLSLEYLKLFVDAEFIDIADGLPETTSADGNVCFITHNLFDRPIEFQQKWNVIFGEAKCRQIVLESKSIEALDEIYLDGKLDEMLYERLSFRQTVVDPLKDSSFEELAVQPLTKNEPRLVFDSDTDDVALASDAKAVEKEIKSGRGLTRLFRGFGRK